jgi:hypothetical protein
MVGFHHPKWYVFSRESVVFPRSSMRENLIKEKHSGGLVGHFGHDKTIAIVGERYYWPHLQQDVKKFVQICRVCQMLKGTSQNIGLY